MRVVLATPIAVVAILLASCAPAAFTTPNADIVAVTPSATATNAPREVADANEEVLSPSPLPPTATVTLSATPTPIPWQEMPVVPVVSEFARQVYVRGLEMGNDPHGFSVIGDCQNVTDFFLSAFDHPGQYDLGEYGYLQETIDYYAGSFSRERVAVSGGFNVAAVLSPLWNNLEACDPHESPLACEYRINNPSVAIISMETWWYDRPAETYAGYLRQIVEYSIAEGVVPILATKADNLEGDWSINAAIVQVAQEYDVPLWNFWRAMQPLPGHGLTLDGFHLTYGRPFFSIEANMNTGWAVRNLTALQALDAVRRAVTGDEPAPVVGGNEG